MVRKCDKVYLEHYTSILTCGKEELEAFYGREIILADRELVEQGAEELLSVGAEGDVALLVVGDPFGATTHTDLVLRAKERNIPHAVVHNASIMNAVACTGLQLYNFGETVSIPFWTETWRPDSFLDKILVNRRSGLHTLCLLDIKVKEQSDENLARGRKIYEPPRFMSCQQAAHQLLQAVQTRASSSSSTETATPERTAAESLLEANSQVVCVARVGAADQRLVACSLEQAASLDMGPPLHSLVIPGELHYLEVDALKLWTM